MRMIDADVLLKELRRNYEKGEIDKYTNIELQVRLEQAPTIDPVRHGRWKRTDAYPHRIYCSVCYSTFAQEHWRVWVDGSLPRAFCPNCGAKMDGDADD